ncbi:MAG: LCP family protein [Lachnospiraceae bacterium]|nr:LCP family protein [Lachnospiraceae bacterium]
MDPERAKRKKRKIIAKRLAVFCTVLFSIAVILFASFQIVRAVGKNTLRRGKAAIAGAPALTLQEVTEEEKAAVGWQEGWVKYDDKYYAYNEDILTFLIMGIDKYENVRAVEQGTNGGQADALFLLVLDPGTKEIKIVGINRNTMTAVDVYDAAGAYVTTLTAQICIQHGFGNGTEESSAYQVAAVSNLFYRLPIHGYAAINMSAIPTLNDAVGGVTLTCLEDLTAWDETLTCGSEVHLMGNSAYVYVSRRDITVYGSADARLERQKQYLNAYLAQAKERAKGDLSIVTGLYSALNSTMVTDVTLNEVAYLAPVIRDYAFDKDHIYTLKGETRMGHSEVTGDAFEEFYPDRDAMYRMILDVFYKEVN